MKRKPYTMPDAAVSDLLYESILCASEGVMDEFTDYENGGDPFGI